MSLWSQPASCTYWRAPTINLGILPRSFMPIMRVSMTYCPLHKTELLVDTIFLWCKWPEEMASLHDVDIAVVLLLLPPSLPRISHSIWTHSDTTWASIVAHEASHSIRPFPKHYILVSCLWQKRAVQLWHLTHWQKLWCWPTSNLRLVVNWEKCTAVYSFAYSNSINQSFVYPRSI